MCVYVYLCVCMFIYIVYSLTHPPPTHPTTPPQNTGGVGRRPPRVDRGHPGGLALRAVLRLHAHAGTCVHFSLSAVGRFVGLSGWLVDCFSLGLALPLSTPRPCRHVRIFVVHLPFIGRLVWFRCQSFLVGRWPFCLGVVVVGWLVGIWLASPPSLSLSRAHTHPTPTPTHVSLIQIKLKQTKHPTGGPHPRHPPRRITLRRGEHLLPVAGPRVSAQARHAGQRPAGGRHRADGVAGILYIYVVVCLFGGGGDGGWVYVHVYM